MEGITLHMRRRRRRRIRRNLWNMFFYLSYTIMILCNIYSLQYIYQELRFNKYTNDVEMQTRAMIAEAGDVSWDFYDVDSRLSFISEIAVIEQLSLGLEDNIEIICEDMESSSGEWYESFDTAAYYSPDKNMITISEYYLQVASLDSAINTICHEMYHAYEYKLACEYRKMSGKDKRIYMNSHMAEYDKNLCNYVSGEESYYEYKYQVLEVDARYYAEKKADVYLQNVKVD